MLEIAPGIKEDSVNMDQSVEIDMSEMNRALIISLDSVSMAQNANLDSKNNFL